MVAAQVRYVAELADPDLNRDVDAIPRPHWDPRAPTLREYAAWRGDRR